MKMFFRYSIKISRSIIWVASISIMFLLSAYLFKRLSINWFSNTCIDISIGIIVTGTFLWIQSFLKERQNFIDIINIIIEYIGTIRYHYEIIKIGLNDKSIPNREHIIVESYLRINNRITPQIDTTLIDRYDPILLKKWNDLYYGEKELTYNVGQNFHDKLPELDKSGLLSDDELKEINYNELIYWLEKKIFFINNVLSASDSIMQYSSMLHK